MYLKKIVLIGMCAILAGCSSGQVSDEVLINTLPDQLYTYYKNTSLQLQYPKGFRVKTRNQVAETFSNAVELLFESDKQGPIMKSLIVVESFSVPQNASFDETVKAFYDNNNSRLVNFVELPSEIYNTVVGGKYFQTELKHFKGRRNLSGNDVQFFQTYLLKDGKLYMATAAFDPLDPFMEAESLKESLKTMTIF